MSGVCAVIVIVALLTALSAGLIYEQRCRERNRDVKGFADRFNREHPKKRRRH